MVNYIRALSEAPGAFPARWTKVKNIPSRLSFIGCRRRTRAIVNTRGGVIVQLHDGQIALLDVQLEGRKRLKYKDFINGQKNLIGSVLS
jgi:methionyl-tRNA formyltransferase